jgi:hypothetical protein
VERGVIKMKKIAADRNYRMFKRAREVPQKPEAQASAIMDEKLKRLQAQLDHYVKWYGEALKDMSGALKKWEVPQRLHKLETRLLALETALKTKGN